MVLLSYALAQENSLLSNMYTRAFLGVVPQPIVTHQNGRLRSAITLCLRTLCLLLALSLAEATFRCAAAETIQISEFLANNFHGLADEDANYEDWIELHNASSQTVSLEGWYLTDNKSNLKKWRFPKVTMSPNSYRIVFASGKDRRPLFGELHTNFKLSNKNGYLGLVASNGVTVVSEYSPSYPIQAPNVSYGFPVQDFTIPLITSSNRASFFVPGDDRYATLWTAQTFDDSQWTRGTNGIGYETDSIVTITTPATLADSVKEFSGVQGQTGWYYGYWDRGNDVDGTYATNEFVAFPKGSGALSASNFFTNNVWRFYPPDVASTQLDRFGGSGSGDNGLASRLNHWTIRRWVSETNGLVRIYGTIGDQSTCADPSQGDGITGRIYIDGVEVFRKSVRQSSMGYSILSNVALGSMVDFVIDPGDGHDDRCDSAIFTAVVSTVSPTAQLLADSIADWSTTGTQGDNNWQYGYYNHGADTVAGYQTADFTPFPDTLWNGTEWKNLDNTPPYDEIGQQMMRPNGIFTDGGEHWMVRRWISPVSGTLTIDWHLAKATLGGAGVTAHIYLKGGAQKDGALIGGNSLIGTNHTFNLTGVQAGDPIDFVLDPAGAGSVSDDAFDQSFFDARIYGNATLTPLVASDVSSKLKDINSSLYARIPFGVTNAGQLQSLTLKMRYDAGFVAYLNGVEVQRMNAPSTPTWNSAATVERGDAEATGFDTFDLTTQIGLLVNGTNVLAIHGLNSSAGDSDFLIQATLSAAYQVTDPTLKEYFATPTPGAPNGLGTTNLGPLVLTADHVPANPAEGQDLNVTAQVVPSFQPIGDVQLVYRVMYGTEASVPMFDDGQHGDGAAADGVYGGAIPGSAFKAGNMVRYYIKATDSITNLTRFPVFVKGKEMPEYWGTVVRDPSLTNPLPVLHWFSASASAGDSGGTGSIYYNGQFLDNVRFKVHGQSSAGFAKHSWNIDLNSGYKLTWKDGEPSIHDINLLTTYPDKAKMRNMLSYNSYRDAGTAYHFIVPVRVQLNGKFWGDFHFGENGDDTYLQRNKIDPNGSLYKMYSTFDNADGNKKQTRVTEGIDDLKAFNVGMAPGGKDLLTYMYDNLNIPEVVDYLATMTITANTDCCHKNYYFYRDTEGTGEWSMFPWDQDLSFGRVWSGGPTYWDDTMHTNTDLRVGGNNRVPQGIFNNPVFDQMYLRRLRTLMEELLQAPGLPAHEYKYERFIDEWIPKLAPDAALDLAKWGTWSGDESTGTEHDSKNLQTLTQAANIIKFTYLPGRRNFLFSSVPEIPKSQPSNIVLRIGQIEFSPSSGNQDEEYFTIINTNKIHVDISHWRIQGGVDYQFKGGTVIPTNGVLYVSPNVRAFRNRSVSPHGGQQLFVQGNYNGHLSARGETIQLVDTAGNIVVSTNFVGAPSAAQNGLRITEIMYHPVAAPSGSSYVTDDFEYIELKNVGSTTVPLAGIRFVNGITFDFTGSTIPSLAPGETVLIVKNSAAFASRYGTGKRIAGEYTGVLSDAGERLTLVDARTETVLDFSYNNSWYPLADGVGFSLVIADEKASWDTWGLKTSWRASGTVAGSPGQDDPAPTIFAPVVINEILTNSKINSEDAVEILNPGTTSVDLSHWYLTDDFNTPQKYQIPNNTVLDPGAYLLIPESKFNTGASGSFALRASGDQVYLFSANAKGDLTGYVTGYEFGGSLGEVTMGRYTNSIGEVFFVPQIDNTLGKANGNPRVGPVVFSEIMYHPLENPDGTDAAQQEYVELINITEQAVPLFDPGSPTNTWRVTGGISFNFPTNITLAAHERVLLVNFNPTKSPEAKAAFLARYNLNIGAGTTPRLFGPYGGQLNNSSDDLALYQPDAPSLEGSIPFALADWVHYGSIAPWPSLADGFGTSLHRVANSAFGNDPANWIAAKPSPGYEESSVGAPSFVQQPAGSTLFVGTTIHLESSANGGSPLAYQWFQDEHPIPGATSPVLDIPNSTILDGGNYKVVAMNSAGSAESDIATVLVEQPVYVKDPPSNVTGALGKNVFFYVRNQPTNRNVTLGTNVVLIAGAAGQSPLSYQWFFNDQPISGANSNVLYLPQIGFDNEGRYKLQVRDAISTVYSGDGTLRVFDKPTLVVPVSPANVLLGEDATFFVQVTGRGPLTYRWLRDKAVRTNDISTLNYSVFTIRNVNLAAAGNYSVTITNPAGASISSTGAVLTILQDLDNDHMADVWELANHFLTNNAADALQDADGDGVSNLDEYRADTDPHDPTSYLKIDRNGAGTTETFLEFLAKSNHTYTVEFRESAATGLWQTLTNVMMQSTSRVEHVIDPYPLAQGRVYRLQTPARTDRPGVTPVILSSPSDVRINRGSQLILSVVASGKGNLTYQWRKEGQPIPGANANQWMIDSIQPSDEGSYSVDVTDDTNTVSAPASQVIVLDPPTIQTAPKSQEAHVGDNVEFTVTATGNNPLRYRWFLNGVLIPNVSGPALRIPSVAAKDAGDYTVLVRHTTPKGPAEILSVPATLRVSP